LNHSSSSARFSTRTNTIDNNPQGNIKKEDARVDGVAMTDHLNRKER
jgi:hypothetical protein